MGDDNSEQRDVPTFEIEYTASELYMLNSILQNAAVSLDDFTYASAADDLSLKVMQAITVPRFDEGMDKEIEQMMEAEQRRKEKLDIPDMPQKGVQ